MEYRELGQTGMRVSVVAMGCWALAGDYTWGPQEEADSLAAVDAARAAGINFFDTAEAYGDGRSEEVLGRALAGHRQQAVIATKVSDSHLAPAEVAAACERSLRRLQTDYIDLYQIHWPSRQVPLGETLAALEKLREQGKVRAVGVCNFGPQDLGELVRATPPEGGGRVMTNQVVYNLLFRAIEYEIKPRCVEAGVGILCYSPLAKGLLSGKFGRPDDVPLGRARTRHFAGSRPGTRHGQAGWEDEVFATIGILRSICAEAGLALPEAALAWALEQPGVVAVLAGARKPEQSMQNARAAELQLPAEVSAALTRATEALKEHLGPNADEYQGESRLH